jgi:hypothetical protein
MTTSRPASKRAVFFRFFASSHSHFVLEGSSFCSYTQTLLLPSKPGLGHPLGRQLPGFFPFEPTAHQFFDVYRL